MAWFKNRMVSDGQIATKKLTVTPVIPDFTGAAESGNAISVLIQLKDPDGNAVARQVVLLCKVLKSDGLQATSSEFRLSETGDGSEVSTTAKPTLLVRTDAEGQCTVAVTDQAGSYTGKAYLVVEPLSTFGSSSAVELTFA